MTGYKLKTSAYDATTRERHPMTLEVEIDWDRLARVLASKAYSNKSGKSVVMDGLIVVTAPFTRHSRKKGGKP